MKKEMRHLLTASIMSVVLVLLLSGCGSRPASTGADRPEAITIAVQDIPNDAVVARVKGWYENELGVKVNFKKFDSGRDINQAFAANSIDFGLLGTTPVVVGIAGGIDYEIIWIHDVIGAAEALVVKNTSNIGSVEQLRGKQVAVPFGSTAHYSLLNALRLAGVDNGDVVILDMQPADIFAAWQRGDIDAAYVWHPVLGSLLENGKGRTIIDSAQLAEKSVITADLGVVSRKLAQTYPAFVSQYINVQQKAQALYRDDRSQAAAAIAQGLGIEQQEALRHSEQLIWLGAQEQLSERYLGTSVSKGAFVQVLKSTADFLVEQKAIDKVPDVQVFDQAINPRYIEEAVQ